ncbi:MAG: hypothetical protein ACKO5R_06325 [Planctomycetaceae bacterium]
MPIKFRCTGCRSKLYVPERWTGNSIVCPRCDTRVVVPDGGGGPAPGSLEGPSIERSLEELEPPGSEAFAAAPFAIDLDAAGRSSGVGASRRRRSRKRGPAAAAPAKAAEVTLPVWVPYALAVAMVVVAVAAFFLGAWWAKAGAAP